MIFEKLGNKKYLLLHYKNVEMHKAYFNDRHTNSWEITEIIRVFNILGWNVELVDRTVTNWVPTRNYDLFISNSSGSSGDNFVIMSEKIPRTLPPLLMVKLVYEGFDCAKLELGLFTTM